MPSESDRFDGDHCFICVSPKGHRFHLYSQMTDEIRIEHIANALSKQVRWSGHLKGDLWYSVAEHSLIVTAIVTYLGGSREEQFMALMHDATEAYLTDIAAPFKRELGTYYEKEALIWGKMSQLFRLPATLPEIVKKADWMALWIEAKHLVVDDITLCHEWVGWNQFGEEAMAMLEREPSLVPYCWPHRIARNAFMNKFIGLSNDR